eukprot:106837-Chlamydomonas_euryale.AAC.1
MTKSEPTNGYPLLRWARLLMRPHVGKYGAGCDVLETTAMIAWDALRGAGGRGTQDRGGEGLVWIGRAVARWWVWRRLVCGDDTSVATCRIWPCVEWRSVGVWRRIERSYVSVWPGVGCSTVFEWRGAGCGPRSCDPRVALNLRAAGQTTGCLLACSKSRLPVRTHDAVHKRAAHPHMLILTC